eukprot:3578207-Alexandrium_andersonii.AAC.1
MSDAEALLRSRRDLILTPVVPFSDIEYADDAAVVARSAPLAEDALAAIMEVAAPFGLTNSRTKTKLLSMGSDLFVAFPDGDILDRSSSAPYLGTILAADGKPDLEVSHRVANSWAAFRKPSPVWKAPVSTHKE